MYNNDRLVEAAATSQIALGIKSPRNPKVLEALARVDRKDFLPDEIFTLNHSDLPFLQDLAGILKEIDDFAKQQVEQQSLLVLPNQKRVDPNVLFYIKLIRKSLDFVNNVRRLEVPVSALAYNNNTLPIGYDQTCSAPSMIALMTDLLELKEGHNVLEIGTGCGYHAAITSELIGRTGKLTTIEIVPELADFSRVNLKRHFKDSRIEVICKDGSKGHLEKASYDRIYLTASVTPGSFDPNYFLGQLDKDDGALMFPVRGENGFGPLHIYTFNGGKTDRKAVGNFAFVELQGENS